MIQNLEATMKAGAVPQAPQFRPATFAQPTPILNTANVNKSSGSSVGSAVTGTDNKVKADGPESAKTVEKMVPPAVEPAKTQEKCTNGVAEDPLGNARTKVQEEIAREFAAIMATGTLRASEAAALATKKVMQKYGHLTVAPPQS